MPSRPRQQRLFAYRYQRAQKWKMAAGISGALFHPQIKTPRIIKETMQTSTSPVQHLGIQCSKNRLYTKNDATQMTAQQHTPRGIAGPRSSASKPRGDNGETERDKIRDLPELGIG
ncbi:Hypothetical predicted protein [Pelobates cultripes]|uniref:Uncharacterized protein n=1 Tax=Pelobates cultripes TaxID=61616 RepID=A0AAD1WMR3_PELCU|nr:Hypothetical predicted protein [Pelobates cultripes]